jgi:hypothetical protein
MPNTTNNEGGRYLVLVTDRNEINVDHPVRYLARDFEHAKTLARRYFPGASFKISLIDRCDGSTPVDTFAEIVACVAKLEAIR